MLERLITVFMAAILTVAAVPSVNDVMEQVNNQVVANLSEQDIATLQLEVGEQADLDNIINIIIDGDANRQALQAEIDGFFSGWEVE